MTRAAAISDTEATPAAKKSIRFPARSFLAFALAPEAPLDEWLEGLDGWTENSPGFFAGRPVVLDLNLLKPEASEVAGLVAILATRGIRIYAIEANGIETLGPDLPPLLKGARPAVIDGRASAVQGGMKRQWLKSDVVEPDRARARRAFAVEIERTFLAGGRISRRRSITRSSP